MQGRKICTWLPKSLLEYFRTWELDHKGINITESYTSKPCLVSNQLLKTSKEQYILWRIILIIKGDT